MTQKEIARELGLSQSSVSFAISGRLDKVSPELAKRVLEHAGKAGYRPPRPLPLPSSKLVGLLISPCLDLSFDKRIVFEAMLGMQRAAKPLGWNFLQKIYSEGEDFGDILKSCSACVSLGYIPVETLDKIASRIPTVVVNQSSDPSFADSVSTDNYGGTRRALLHLHSLGHRRIGFFSIGGGGMETNPAERIGGYYGAMAELGLHPGFSWFFHRDRRERSAADVERIVREAFEELKSLAAPPTAMLLPGDIYAIPFLKVAKENGFSIPRDISIVGFDDLEECLFQEPGISSLRNNFETMGAEAVRALSERVKDPSRLPLRVKVPPELLIRGSVAAPGAPA